MLTKVTQYELLLKPLRGGGGGWKTYTDFQYDDGITLTCHNDIPGEVQIKIEYTNEKRNVKELDTNEWQDVGQEVRELWKKKMKLIVKGTKVWKTLPQKID